MLGWLLVLCFDSIGVESTIVDEVSENRISVLAGGGGDESAGLLIGEDVEGVSVVDTTLDTGDTDDAMAGLTPEVTKVEALWV